MSTYNAPPLATRADIALYSMNTGNPANPNEKRKGALERFIHSSIYAKRENVTAVLHCHAPILVSFSVLKSEDPTQGLRPSLHAAASTGLLAPIYDIATHNRQGSEAPPERRETDLLIRTPELGDELAAVFAQPTSHVPSGKQPGMVLMRGHGATIVSPQGIQDLVHRGIYACKNGIILRDAALLASQLGAIVQTLSEGEVDACGDAVNAVARSWPAWVKALGEDTGLESI